MKTVIHQCLNCYRLRAQATQHFMGELTSASFKPSRPFLSTGVDYSGPVALRSWKPRSKTIIKSHIAVFVWFATKAIHIELVTILTTETFLVAIRRLNATSRKTKDHSLWQCYQLTRSNKWTSYRLQDVAVNIVDSNYSRFSASRRVCVKVHSSTRPKKLRPQSPDVPLHQQQHIFVCVN